MQVSRASVLLLIALMAACCHADDTTAPGRAIPCAEGFGASTSGGRGGAILRVTTLAATGPGSFAEALRARGRRIVVFEVGGVIDLGGRHLSIREPYLTIAGQTAPAPGITLIQGGIGIATHDVIVQHLRIRPGEAGHGKGSDWMADALATSGAANILVDHCSCTWATDENLSASGPRFRGDSPEEWRDHTSHHITISNCIIAEGLSHSTHPKGEHSKGTLLHDNATALAVVGNLFACNVDRNPLAKGGAQALIVNNWISNPGRQAIHNVLVAKEWGEHPRAASRLAVVGNLLEYGPDTAPGVPLFRNHRDSPLELFMENNLALDRDRRPVSLFVGTEALPLRERPAWREGLEPWPAAEVKEHVARNAGARPWDRDPIDRRIVRAAVEGQGQIIDSEQDVGGYPEPPATRAAFRPEAWDLGTMQPLRPRG